jgi:multicomponent Na+:H+ antiporter subunit E
MLGLLILYAVFWAILTEGQTSAWVVGIPSVVIAVLASAILFKPSGLHWRLLGVVKFVPFFLWHSLLGGYAVAKLAWRKKLTFTSETIEYHSRLPDQCSRVFLASAASLLPGTLVMDIRENILLIHVIDSSMEHERELETLERYVVKLFGIDIERSRADG